MQLWHFEWLQPVATCGESKASLQPVTTYDSMWLSGLAQRAYLRLRLYCCNTKRGHRIARPAISRAYCLHEDDLYGLHAYPDLKTQLILAFTAFIGWNAYRLC
jgi:hypothetical protein